MEHFLMYTEGYVMKTGRYQIQWFFWIYIHDFINFKEENIAQAMFDFILF